MRPLRVSPPGEANQIWLVMLIGGMKVFPNHMIESCRLVGCTTTSEMQLRCPIDGLELLFPGSLS